MNLAPADVRKEGAAFDLPMAVGILCATGVVKSGRLYRAMVMGELSLDGSVRPVRGVLPVALHARREGFAPLLVPAANAGGDERQWVKWVKWGPECASAGRAGRSHAGPVLFVDTRVAKPT